MRPGTLSLLAGIDLLTGEAIPLVSQTHKSSDLIGFLKILDARYPEGDTIWLVLDNHSAHTSRETRQFLATLPEGRFVFVFTPTHTSWMNMVESFFNKMAKQRLKGIRVNSKEIIMNEMLEIISNLCSIIAFFVSLFTASKVYKISTKLSIDNTTKRSNKNKVRGSIKGDFVGGDKIEEKY